jgi:DNA-binding PadR family transcriptional regulator
MYGHDACTHPGYGARRMHHPHHGESRHGCDPHHAYAHHAEQDCCGEGHGHRSGGPPPWMAHMMAGRGRRAAKGEVRFLILDALQDQPRHGYEIIQAIEEKSHGAYRPSPGTVYPTLQLLDETGLVSLAADGDKKTYELTGEGRSELEGRRAEVDEAYERMTSEMGWAREGEFVGLFESFPRLFRTIRRSYHHGDLDADQRAAIKQVLDEAAEKIGAIAKGDAAG